MKFVVRCCCGYQGVPGRAKWFYHLLKYCKEMSFYDFYRTKWGTSSL